LPSAMGCDTEKHAQATGVTARDESRMACQRDKRSKRRYTAICDLVSDGCSLQGARKALTEGRPVDDYIARRTVCLEITGWTWTGVTPHAAK